MRIESFEQQELLKNKKTLKILIKNEKIDLKWLNRTYKFKIVIKF